MAGALFAVAGLPPRIAALDTGAPPAAQSPTTNRTQRGTSPAQRPLALSLPGVGPNAPQFVSFQADSEEANQGRYRLVGDVEIDYGAIRFTADRIDFDGVTGEAVASGHVALDLADEHTHIEGTRGAYNLKTGIGEFDNFRGVSGMRFTGRHVTLLSQNPLIFTGRRLERLGPRHYRVEDGTVTSCRLPHPKWTLAAQRLDIELGGNATLHHALFRLFDVPVFYAPYLTHPTATTGRHSGFLLPAVGHDTQKGTVIGDSYFWAPTRSTNLTFGTQYFSARGWADLLGLQTYPSRRAYVAFNLDGVFDRGLPAPNGGRIKQGGQEAHLVAMLEPKDVVASPAGAITAPNPDGPDNSGAFRTAVDANYLSSFAYRLAFTETYAEAINSEVVSTAFTERQYDGTDFSVAAHRYQNFLTASPSTSISLAAVPAVNWSSFSRPLTTFAGVPLYFSWNLEGAELNRVEPGFSSGLLDRVDIYPRLTAPLWTPVGSFTSDLSVRSTSYSRALLPGSSPNAPVLDTQQGLERFAASYDLVWTLPSVERIFSTPGGLLGDRLKHVFEPQLAFRYTGGVDNADDVIRFDDTDILSDTREVDYGFTNRLFTRSGNGPSREFASWTLEQKFFLDPTFGGALTPGARNVFLTTALLTPFAFASLPSRESPISSLVRVSPFRGFDGDWRLDYDPLHGRLNASAFTGTFHFGQLFFSGGHFLVNTPVGLVQLGSSLPPNFNQFHFATGYGNPDRPGLSLAVAAAYDAQQGLFQYTTVQSTYNWDCCGFSVQWRRFALASLRREDQFRVNFSLANVAAFGNLKRQERIF